MYVVWNANDFGFVALSYWAPSAGNLLSLIVLSLRLDMRVRADAIKVLRIIAHGSAEEVLRIVEALGSNQYRQLRADAFADMRLHAVASAMKALDLAPETRTLNQSREADPHGNRQGGNLTHF